MMTPVGSSRRACRASGSVRSRPGAGRHPPAHRARPAGGGLRLGATRVVRRSLAEATADTTGTAIGAHAPGGGLTGVRERIGGALKWSAREGGHGAISDS